MKVLITGGTGFIGSRLALRCLADGHEVLALGRPGDPPEHEAQNAAEIRAAGGSARGVHLTDAAGLADAVRDREVVWHLGATQHEMNVSDEVFREVNVEGVRVLLDLCREAGIRRFVHGSTIGVHGDGSEDPVHEDSPLDATNIYDVTKREGEAVVRSFGERPETVILRIGETYGPADRRLLKLFRGVEKRRFFMIGPGTNLHQPIYVSDLVDALLLAAEHPSATGRVYLVAGPRAITTRRMVEIVAEAVGTTPLRARAPLSVLQAAAFVLEKTLRPLGIQPPLHRRRMNFFVLNLHFSIDRIRDELGFAPRVDFREGASRTAAWYRERGLLDRKDDHT